MIKSNLIEKDLIKRSDRATAKQQSHRVSSNIGLISSVELMPHIVMFLNPCRQIVWANHRFLNRLGKNSIDDFIGLRPGEVLNCINAENAEYGCGTTEQCQECGALTAILQSLDDNSAEKECSILTTSGETLTLRMKSDLFFFDGDPFLIASVNDITNEKNKRIMERVFFHDTMNIAVTIQGFTKILPEVIKKDTEKEFNDIRAILLDAANDLIDQIKWQKDLVLAETNELKIYNSEIQAGNLLEEIKRFFNRIGIFQNRMIEIQYEKNDSFIADKRILKRILINTVKNALEAGNEKERVQIRFLMPDENYVLFEVQNNAYIEEEVQVRIFQKFFSTKSLDRGIGTYSIKLFAEKYLKGQVWFKSNKREGTTFYIKVPKTLE